MNIRKWLAYEVNKFSNCILYNERSRAELLAKEKEDLINELDEIKKLYEKKSY